ncbi:MAG TPA: SRPBCC family protein [Candidatus Binatia bacterium]|nr:SRPBCC family protein [Candidatus Binatia bacterium]
MAQQQVRFEQFFAAPRERVFEYFADHERFGRIWGGRFTRIRNGAAEPNGLGSVREIRTRGMRFEETIVAFERPSLIEYAISRGSPIRNHRGSIRFEAVPGGTKVEYTIRFDPKLALTGGLIAGILCATWHAGVHRAVEDLAQAA